MQVGRDKARCTYISAGSNVTLFDGDEIGGAAGSITVSPTNVDDIMRGLLREIEEAVDPCRGADDEAVEQPVVDRVVSVAA